MDEAGIAPERAEFLRSDYHRGFIAYVGYRATSFSRGRCESRLDVEERHRQQDGFVHAGVMAAMADHTAGYAAFTLAPEGVQILTIEFKINFLRPAAGQVLVCRSRIVREGRSIVVGQSEVFAQNGGCEKMVALATVTMTPVPASTLAAGGGNREEP
ncbi:MAG: PaaI family thioesterase [Thermodesulfobacteriota bacterium]